MPAWPWLLDRPWGLHLITGLLALFVFVLGYGILGDLNVDCGCFGAEELDKQAGLREAFYRDLVLIGMVVPYLYLSRRVREFAGNRKETRCDFFYDHRAQAPVERNSDNAFNND